MSCAFLFKTPNFMLLSTDPPKEWLDKSASKPRNSARSPPKMMWKPSKSLDELTPRKILNTWTLQWSWIRIRSLKTWSGCFSTLRVLMFEKSRFFFASLPTKPLIKPEKWKENVLQRTPPSTWWSLVGVVIPFGEVSPRSSFQSKQDRSKTWRNKGGLASRYVQNKGGCPETAFHTTIAWSACRKTQHNTTSKDGSKKG